MKTRNHLLDFCKVLICIGVIIVHFPFVSPAGPMIATLGTSGVAIFYMISGYGCYAGEEVDNSKAILRRTKRITIITLIAIVAYFLFALIEAAINSKIYSTDAFSYLWEQFRNPWLYPRAILLGDFEFIHADHLWYLVGMIYAYLIMVLVEKFRLRKLLVILMPFLVLLRIGMETYTNSYGADWHMSGNALVGALPMMALGYFIHMKEEKITKINKWLLFSLLIISFAAMFLTAIFKINDQIDISQIFKVSTATLVFIACLKYGTVMKDNFFSRFGAYASLYVYISHFMIGYILTWIFSLNEFPEDFFYTWLPWIVVLASFVLSYIYMEFKFLVTKHRFSFQKPA